LGYIELNKKAFFHNLDYFSNLCGKEKLSIALKDNAYGHGIEEVASMCQEYGIKHVFVRNLREATIAEKFSFDSILVLYEIPQQKYDFIIAVNSLEDLQKVPKNSKIELKIDTHMNRNGLIASEVAPALERIEKNGLILNGVFTHFCCSDEESNITKLQEEEFLKIISEIEKTIKYPFRKHCANSSGAHKVDMKHYDLARVGIGAYGYIDLKNITTLQPVMKLFANKIATKHIQKGEHVGYGSKAFVAPKEMLVSNYNIGYADGFFRLGEQKTATIADGRKILGRVSMDSFSVEGDDTTLCVFDNVENLAKVHNTIVYEILANMKPYIKRYITDATY
jgi:alanine racemase